MTLTSEQLESLAGRYYGMACYGVSCRNQSTPYRLGREGLNAALQKLSEWQTKGYGPLRLRIAMRHELGRNRDKYGISPLLLISLISLAINLVRLWMEWNRDQEARAMTQPQLQPGGWQSGDEMLVAPPKSKRKFATNIGLWVLNALLIAAIQTAAGWTFLQWLMGRETISDWARAFGRETETLVLAWLCLCLGMLGVAPVAFVLSHWEWTDNRAAYYSLVVGGAIGAVVFERLGVLVWG